MALTFTSTAAPVDDQGVKLCVYGPAGVGKTVLGATMPGDPVLISAESGLLSLAPANQMRLWGAVRDIPVIVIKDGAGFAEAYSFLTQSKEAKRFTAVSVDSISEIAEVILNAELAVAKDPRQAYGTMQQTMAKYIRLFRDMRGRDVYFSAKQEKSTDSDGVTRFGPRIPGKNLIQDLPHFFDEVFALCISPKDAQGNTYRYLKTRPDMQFQAKDRSGALSEMEEPNLTAIISKIRGS